MRENVRFSAYRECLRKEVACVMLTEELPLRHRVFPHCVNVYMVSALYRNQRGKEELVCLEFLAFPSGLGGRGERGCRDTYLGHPLTMSCC